MRKFLSILIISLLITFLMTREVRESELFGADTTVTVMELQELSEMSTNDYLIVVDSSAGVTKRISANGAIIVFLNGKTIDTLKIEHVYINILQGDTSPITVLDTMNVTGQVNATYLKGDSTYTPIIVIDTVKSNVEVTGYLNVPTDSLKINSVSITSTSAEINKLDGFTGTYEDLNYAKDVRATGVTSSELDKVDGYTGDATELNYAKSLYDTGVTDTEFDKLDGLTPTTTQINILADDGSKGNALLGRSSGGAVGNIQSIDGDPNDANPLTFINMPFWVKASISYDDTSPVTIFAVADGYVVHSVVVKVGVAWNDGSKAFEVGYTADSDGFITNLGAGLAAPKYYGVDDTYWGVRIYNVGNTHRKIHVFDGASNIIATFVGTGNGGSQGSCDVWVQVSRLD